MDAYGTAKYIRLHFTAQAKPACLLVPEEIFWHQTDFIFGLGALENVRKWLQREFHTGFWVRPNFEAKKNDLIASVHSL